MSPFFTFSRWDGTQIDDDAADAALLDQFSEDVLARGDVDLSLRSLMRRGVHPRDGEGDVQGIEDMLRKLRADRQEMLRKHDLGSVLDDLRNKLDEVVTTEREGMESRLAAAQDATAASRDDPAAPLDPETAARLADRLQEMAKRNNAFLDTLPDDLGGAVQELNSYEFMDPEAKRLFEELKALIQQQFVDRQFRKLNEDLKSMSPQDTNAAASMMQDLNEVLQRHKDGDPDTGFDEFMQQWGNAFGENPPDNIDELVDRLQTQMAQSQSLMNSLSAEQRQELQGLIAGMLENPGLMQQMSMLEANLDALRVGGELGRKFRFKGDESVALHEALDLMDELNRMDDLESQLKHTQYGGGNLDDVDADQVGKLLGEDALDSLERLRQLTERLVREGLIRTSEEGGHEFTARGIRRIGQKALAEIFGYLRRSYAGRHLARERGRGGEPTEATRNYAYGDEFNVDMRRTVQSAVLRDGSGTPVRLNPDDFQVYETEDAAQASTVLMIDLSLSMAMRGNFVTAKKVALALDTLIRTQFGRDNLYVVGFSTYAREMKPDDLASLSWDEFEPYTNIQHGLAVAQKLLSRHSGNRQIIMVSDGEPTAHMENGRVFLQYPPSPRTIQETLKEVGRTTRAGISINTFMLEQNAFLMEFVDRLTRINKGRVFYTSSEHLGEYVLVDYLNSRRRRTLVS